MNLDEQILSDDPESNVVEADDDAAYEPFPEEGSSVIVTEPDIISVGRARYKIAKRKERNGEV